MVTGIFDNLLQELAVALKVKELHPDSANACRLKMKSGLTVQIELDKTQQFLLMASPVASIPASRYRENVFREALKANSLPAPNYGVFCYSPYADKLVLMGEMSLQNITGEKIHEYLIAFAEKVKNWQEAIERGDIPSLVGTSSSGASRPAGMFGMRP